MASRPTRNQARTVQSPSSIDSLTSTPLLKNRARKSMGGSPSSKINRAAASKKPRRTRSSSDSSNDSSMVHSTTTVPSQIQDSSEDVGTSSKGKRKLRRTQRPASDNEGSDTDYAPPVKGTERGRMSLPSTSGIRPSSSTAVNNVSRGITDMRLNTSLGSNTSMNTSNQGKFMKWVNKCVFYMLVADQKKHAIKKTDIVKNVFDGQNSKENYSAVLVKANEVLKKTFGLEILEINNTKNNYILINILDSDHGIREFAEYSSEELQKRGLIFLLLTIIFMNENAITEDKLWKALEPLGLFSNSTIAHPTFGNVKKYITVDLVKEMYLEYKVISKDPIQHEFTWGERAVQEIKKEDLLEFACKMMGNDTKPEDWKLQYIDAKRSSSEV